MTFRELSAWVMSLALIVGGAFYFNTVIKASSATDGLAPPILGPIIIYIGILILLSIIGHVLGAIAARGETDAPADERDRRVIAQAGNVSGVVFGVGVMAGLTGYLFTYNGDLLFYIAFGSLMVSQLAEYLLQIWYYRSGV
ncbi:MAG: hypothetical protein AAFR11_15330 [Pseudomonadota bacterium]